MATGRPEGVHTPAPLHRKGGVHTGEFIKETYKKYGERENARNALSNKSKQ
jgi:hypothetical protein